MKNVKFGSITRSRLDETHAACPTLSCLFKATNAYHHHLSTPPHPIIIMSSLQLMKYDTSPPPLGQSCSTRTARTLCKLAATKIALWFPKPRQPPPTSKTKSGSHWWPWEWLCELLAVGSLGAMCFALWYYQDRPQADWQQSYFTLNGLVALLATLTKTGLIIPVSAAIGQRKWLRFMPNRKGIDRARRVGDFEAFDEASRGSLGSAKLIISLNAWYDGCRLPFDFC
jgi:hypothetical protein